MPRVSSAPEDAFHFKGTYQDGWGEIIDAKTLVFQYPPAKEARNNRPAGWQDPPALVAELTIQRLQDADGIKAPTPPEQVLLSIQRPDKQTGELTACHPGRFPDGNLEAEPEDAGGELGSEGDTLYAMQDGYQLNDKCKWMTFTASLQEKGFKPPILKRTYFPDLIGLRAYFTTIVKPKQSSDDFDSSVFVVKEIRRFPYEQLGGGGATGIAPAAKATAVSAAPKGRAPSASTKTAPSRSATAPVAPAPNGAADMVEEITTALITDTLAPSKKGATVKDIKRLRVEALMCISGHKPAIPQQYKKGVQDTLTEAWLEATGVTTGLYEIQEDGSVRFS